MGELASDGRMIYTNQTAMNYGYDGSGNLITQSISQYDGVYVKTFTWASGKMTAESLWVKQ